MCDINRLNAFFRANEAVIVIFSIQLIRKMFLPIT